MADRSDLNIQINATALCGGYKYLALAAWMGGFKYLYQSAGWTGITDGQKECPVLSPPNLPSELIMK